MQPRHNTIEDLLKDESFINYCLRRNERDIQYWEQYIANNPGKKELIDAAIQEYRLLFTALANADVEEQLQLLKKKIANGEQAPVVVLAPAVRRTRLLNRFKYGIAAAIVAIAVAVYLLRPSSTPSAESGQQIIYSCKQGERKSFQFPDGTQVVLNAGSEIILNNNYATTTREVFLKGEAFFEVQHNKQVPFIVHTSTMDVKALGTAFNVKSYHNENKTEAVLIRGLVEVTLKKDNNRKLLLHPNEKVRWTEPENGAEPIRPATPANRDDGEYTLIKRVKKTDNGYVKELAWVENNLTFDNEPFEEIALQLNRWYDVDIRFESEQVKQYHFTATFKKEKIEQVLNILKASKQFNYRKNGQTILIY
jgi:transmembrane sensor